MLTVRTVIMAVCSGFLATACAVPNGALVNPWVVTPTPAPEPVTYADVYKYQGSRQCENSGVPLAEMQRQLQMSGVTVTNATCGMDGRMYPAFCGGADGKINIFTVPSTSVNAALSQGFVLLTNLPEAQRTSCYGANPANGGNNNGTSTTYPYNGNNSTPNTNNNNTNSGFIPYAGGSNDSYYSYQ